jgi:hypothetical protein
MRCWACENAIHLTDLVNELPIVGTLVHRECYERVTGEKAPLSHSLSGWLKRRWDKAA